MILLHQTLDDYVTLSQVYEHVISADKLRWKIGEGERHFRANHRCVVVDKREHLFTTALKGWSWHDDATGTRTWAEWSADLADALASAGIAWTLEHATPSGDQKFVSLARQARCIPLVATQSISSLRSALSGESWRTLLQGLRTKIFLTLADDFSAQMAADLCGKIERLKPGYTITEAGRDARVRMLTGRPAAHRATVSASRTYSLQYECVFQPKVFAELQRPGHCAAVRRLEPEPPTYCSLKLHYLNVQTSYFDHAARGAL